MRITRSIAEDGAGEKEHTPAMKVVVSVGKSLTSYTSGSSWSIQIHDKENSTMAAQ